MNIRISILAVCASTLALALTATTGICGERTIGFEKTFLDGQASKRAGAPKISDNESPRPQDRIQKPSQAGPSAANGRLLIGTEGGMSR